MDAEALKPLEEHRRELRLHSGVWLRAQRESRGLSQREFAERVGAVYYTFISQIEAGRGRIPSERYEAWAEALDLPPRDFAIRMLSYYEPVTHALIFGDNRVAGTGQPT
jgi:transcriptional regulator with XRE-family HTH domain